MTTPSDFAALQESHHELKRGHEALSRQVQEVQLDLQQNTVTTEQIKTALKANTEATERVEKNTSDLVGAFNAAVKVYRVSAWFGRMVREWGWLPAMVIGAYGQVRGWWSDVMKGFRP